MEKWFGSGPIYVSMQNAIYITQPGLQSIGISIAIYFDLVVCTGKRDCHLQKTVAIGALSAKKGTLQKPSSGKRVGFTQYQVSNLHFPTYCTIHPKHSNSPLLSMVPVSSQLLICRCGNHAARTYLQVYNVPIMSHQLYANNFSKSALLVGNICSKEVGRHLLQAACKAFNSIGSSEQAHLYYPSWLQSMFLVY